MKELLKDYMKPTPKHWRIIGDSLLTTSLFALGMQVISGSSMLLNLFSAMAIIGKFITNLNVHEDSQ